MIMMLTMMITMKRERENCGGENAPVASTALATMTMPSYLVFFYPENPETNAMALENREASENIQEFFPFLKRTT